MLVEIIWNANTKRIRRKKIEKAQSNLDSECIEKMREFVPVASDNYRHAGHLRDSAKAPEPGKITYTAFFARHAYYTPMNHRDSGNPRARRLWFEVTKSKYKHKFLKHAARTTGARIK